MTVEERIEAYNRYKSTLKPEHRWPEDKGPPPARWVAEDGTIVYRSRYDFYDH